MPQGGGFLAAGLVFMCWLTANAFSHKLWDQDIKPHLPDQFEHVTAWQAAVAIHVVAWILQVRVRLILFCYTCLCVCVRGKRIVYEGAAGIWQGYCSCFVRCLVSRCYAFLLLFVLSPTLYPAYILLFAR